MILCALRPRQVISMIYDLILHSVEVKGCCAAHHVDKGAEKHRQVCRPNLGPVIHDFSK